MFGFSAAIGIARFFGAHRIAGRVARAAVGEAFGQVRTAIPLRASRRLRCKTARSEVERFPGAERSTNVRRKRQRIGAIARAYGVAGHHERIDRFDVVVRDLGEMIVWECGIEIAASPVDAIVHRTNEVALRPFADASFGVGGDVGRINGAERCRQRPAPGIGLPALGRVATGAITDRREMRAFGDDCRVVVRDSRRSGRSACDRGGAGTHRCKPDRSKPFHRNGHWTAF